jgi:nucleotide-binding universal stress UspA family protein
LILAFPETLNQTGCSQSSKPTTTDPMIIYQGHQQKQTRPVNELPQTLVL